MKNFWQWLSLVVIMITVWGFHAYSLLTAFDWLGFGRSVGLRPLWYFKHLQLKESTLSQPAQSYCILREKGQEMTLDEEIEKGIAKIVGGLKCPKDFKCCRSSFETLCQAEDIGLDSYLECLEKNPRECTFSLSFGDGHFCKCPLRVYLAKNLEK